MKPLEQVVYALLAFTLALLLLLLDFSNAAVCQVLKLVPLTVLQRTLAGAGERNDGGIAAVEMALSAIAVWMCGF